tara:strand:+ start:96 stop:392 length:297 start_codon:yes stop_codon:yes gene_type:complete
MDTLTLNGDTISLTDTTFSSKSFDYDPVNKPVHYNLTGIECIDYIKQVLSLDGFIDYCHGNVIKYQHRYRYKTKPLEDMRKAQWYLDKMLKAMEEKHK